MNLMGVNPTLSREHLISKLKTIVPTFIFSRNRSISNNFIRLLRVIVINAEFEGGSILPVAVSILSEQSDNYSYVIRGCTTVGVIYNIIFLNKIYTPIEAKNEVLSEGKGKDRRKRTFRKSGRFYH